MSKAAEYLICKDRGHIPSGRMLLSYPPYDVCAKCGTGYRYGDPPLFETGAPTPPGDTALDRSPDATFAEILADKCDALAAKNARLREALERIAETDLLVKASGGAWTKQSMERKQAIASAALAPPQQESEHEDA